MVAVFIFRRRRVKQTPACVSKLFSSARCPPAQPNETAQLENIVAHSDTTRTGGELCVIAVTNIAGDDACVMMIKKWLPK